MDDCDVSTSVSTVRSLHFPADMSICTQVPSNPSSPRSSALPSPPDSPSTDSVDSGPESVSSFPSVSSSFFFSSAAASPPHIHASTPPEGHHEHEATATHGLIIPSLALPTPLPRPTPWGQMLGQIKLIFLSLQKRLEDPDDNLPLQLLSEDNDEVVDIDPWEQSSVSGARIFKASTNWIEHRDPHGLEKFEPSRNIEIFEGRPPTLRYDQDEDVTDLVKHIQSIFHQPFLAVSDILADNKPQSATTANLLSSSSSPLFTAILLAVPSSPSPLEQILIRQLSPQIPIIILPRPKSYTSRYQSYHSNPGLSSFQPASVLALKRGLFKSPDTLGVLRREAANKYLHWREVERVSKTLKIPPYQPGPGRTAWKKDSWEFEWETRLSRDVAQKTLQESRSLAPDPEPESCYCGTHFDPLHLPSILAFSLGLFGPLQRQIQNMIRRKWNTNLAVVSGICIGVGVGLLLK